MEDFDHQVTSGSDQCFQDEPGITEMAKIQKNILVVFDFDHTLMDDNTDTWIRQLSSDVKQLQKTTGICWTDKMSSIFRKLNEQGVQKIHFDRCLATLPFTRGMKELLTFITKRYCAAENIIISDSNTYFIDYILQKANIEKNFSKIFSNPAFWKDNGCLNIEHFHSHTCTRCPTNLCKGIVLKSYIEKSERNFETIVYIGDGRGDYCPCLQLSKNDFIFARKNYQLAELLVENPPKSNPHVIYWEDAFNILDHFKKNIVENDITSPSTPELSSS